MTSVSERLLNCFRPVFPELSDAELTQASRESVPTWDSLAGVNLLSLVEEEFALRVPDTDLEQFHSFGSAERYLSNRLEHLA